MLSSSSRFIAATRVASSVMVAPARNLNLHEYQSKELMDSFGVNTQRFRVAATRDEAVRGAKELCDEKPLVCGEFVIKAQVHAGGRGKGHFLGGSPLEGGGIKFAAHDEHDKVGEITDGMVGYPLVTKQTTAEGVVVKKVQVAEALDISRETYFAILMDRDFGGPVMVGSPAGGMAIEDVAEETPELIFKMPVDITEGVTREQTMDLAANLGFEGEKQTVAAEQMEKLYDCFIASDCCQIEINPLGETPDGQVVAFDAKLDFDDNAAFRQEAIFAQRDTAEEDPREVEADKHGLNYIGMDGNIACLVNGAGLAMATMDAIKMEGGEPANFLDCGGTATEETITAAFKLLTSDPRVKCILVNIFGGIVNCATIANGIIGACKTLTLEHPLVVRLEGTNVDAAKKLLEESNLPIITADEMGSAAKKAVAALPK
jgi:succinyl-CoA synthetase beta subunit